VVDALPSKKDSTSLQLLEMMKEMKAESKVLNEWRIVGNSRKISML